MFNGTFLTNNTRAATAIPSGNLWYLSGNKDGVREGENNMRIAANVATGSLSDGDVTILYNAIDAYMSGIGAKNSEQILNSGKVSYKISVVNRKSNIFVATQNNNYKLAIKPDSLLFSTNTGVNYSYRKKFVGSHLINMSFITDNGIIVFSTTKNEVFYSNDSLATIDTVHIEGVTIHTPVNSSYPGSYFGVTSRISKAKLNGAEVRLFGNYANIQGGAAPVQIYQWKSSNPDTIKA